MESTSSPMIEVLSQNFVTELDLFDSRLFLEKNEGPTGKSDEMMACSCIRYGIKG
jgi:hypothetical protein